MPSACLQTVFARRCGRGHIVTLPTGFSLSPPTGRGFGERGTNTMADKSKEQLLDVTASSPYPSLLQRRRGRSTCRLVVVSSVLMCQQELLRAIQIVGVDEINAVSQHLGPEHGLVRRAPKAHAPALLMGFGYDVFELVLLRLGYGA
jgi:hypothetical protein